TCLKKCYFETYRFSEDLDFTISEPSHLDDAFLVKCLKEIAEWIYDSAGIEIPQELIRF
ncbi:MAG: nucleotidyl transferase AbiEii/AbiGii toxin family protein, partial [Proteobacteria bacterium]|nr:nucleotidyl transferase AbiEii/AbiGii toxin family protein [Pseudomonadota bacterium]